MAEGKLRRVSSDDIEHITGNFEEVVGTGSSGTVYRGYCHHLRRQVAVKIMHQECLGASCLREEFNTELELLGKIRHPNVISLLGVCSERFALVYEFAANRSMAQCLHRFSHWDAALDAMVDMARGLHHLHGFDPPIIHRDVTASNVLVDVMLHCSLGDLGVAKLCPLYICGPTQVTTRVIGTPGYLDPHYLNTGKLTMKTDVFALGVIILQLISQKAAVYDGEPLRDFLLDGRRDGASLSELVVLSGHLSNVLVDKVWALALQSTSHRPTLRPSAEDLLSDLTAIVSGRKSVVEQQEGELYQWGENGPALREEEGSLSFAEWSRLQMLAEPLLNSGKGESLASGNILGDNRWEDDTSRTSGSHLSDPISLGERVGSELSDEIPPFPSFVYRDDFALYGDYEGSSSGGFLYSGVSDD
eukprot:TRINITY_DN49093_c0_g1_i1.p1 TRINITY_DN49093_c0_g1~~TRINITY_DN49093_c0_g1_i1.p1  ORF type:complete len:417 (-),score=35.79 TRINITY_DN49093_c0_g1_i1:218-1468(-)